VRNILVPITMLLLGAAFSLWLLLRYEWPYSPYPQDLLPAHPVSDSIELGPAISVETDELRGPLSTSDSAQDSEEANE
jgi:hypothetical protein